MDDLTIVVKVSLCVALLASVITFAQNTDLEPYSDPWFIPILVVMVWWSFKRYPDTTSN